VSLETPVLFVIYRRPEATRRVFEAIAAARPRHLFIAADGPGTPADRQACEAARTVVQRIDWECDARRDFSDQNLGLNRRMISAINWVFREFDTAIVLEDDCLPHPQFFGFCSSMLHRYHDDPRVLHVSGECYRLRRRGNSSYFFSKYPLAWGWGTWRRAWSLFDPLIRAWPQFREQPEANALFDSADERRYWLSTFARLYDDQAIGTSISWDYAWYFACMTNGLSIHPASNLVSNIGHGPLASNTRDVTALSDRPTEPLGEPLVHPDAIVRDRQADLDTFDWRFPGALLKHQRSLRHQMGRPARWAMRMVRRGLGGVRH
jgi:hypothetical protein